MKKDVDGFQIIDEATHMTTNDIQILEEAADKASRLFDVLNEAYDEKATPENFQSLLEEIEAAKKASRSAEAAFHWGLRKFQRAA